MRRWRRGFLHFLNKEGNFFESKVIFNKHMTRGSQGNNEDDYKSLTMVT